MLCKRAYAPLLLLVGITSNSVLYDYDFAVHVNWLFLHWDIGFNGCMYYTPCLKKTSHLLTCYNLDIHGSITIIFGTSVTEKIGNQNVLYFLTSPKLCLCTTWRNRKHKNCVFSLRCCMLFTKKHMKHINISPGYNWTTLDLSKRSTGCTRQDLWFYCLFPTCFMLTKSIMGRSLCKRWELFFVKPQWKSMNSINGISFISTNVDTIKHITDDNFSFRKTAHCACNTVQLLQRSRLIQHLSEKCDFHVFYLRWHIKAPFDCLKKVKASHTRHRALGPELIPVYRQSACRWP